MTASTQNAKFRPYTAIVLLVGFSICLLLPSFLMFGLKVLDAETLFNKYSISKSDFSFAFYRVNEILSWSTICITAIIIIFANTIYYGVSFKDELMDNRRNVSKGWFNGISYLYIIWALGTLAFTWVFKSNYDEFIKVLNKTYSEKIEKGKVLTIDRQFTMDLSNVFSDFIHNVEWFTIGTIALFIFIDILSYIVKRKQIKNTENETQTEEIKLLIPQKSFVFNQLFMVDIPVIIGVFLIKFFVSQIPKEDSYANYSQSAFIAGGIGMHLIISQFIFLFLNFKYKYREFQIKNSAS